MQVYTSACVREIECAHALICVYVGEREERDPMQVHTSACVREIECAHALVCVCVCKKINCKTMQLSSTVKKILTSEFSPKTVLQLFWTK